MNKFDIEVVGFNDDLQAWTIEADGFLLEVGDAEMSQLEVEDRCAFGIYNDDISEFIEMNS